MKKAEKYRPVVSAAHRRRDWIMTIKSYFFFLPNLTFFVVLGLYPMAWSIRFLFYRYNGRPFVIPEFIGLGNFIRVFTRDPYYWQSVVRTFVYAGGKLVFTIPIAFLLAIILNRPFRINRFFQSAIFMPTITSSAVMALIFYLLFNVYNGEINRYLMALHLVDEPVNWLGAAHAMKTVLIVAVWGAIGNYMVYFIAGLQTIPQEVTESAIMDGANRWQTMISITIPMMGPILRIIIMLAIAGSMGDMGTIMVMTEGGPVNATMVMSLYGYKLMFPISQAGTMPSPELGYGAAVGSVSGLISGIITLFYLWTGRKMDQVF
jgi:ABC-type sugar transport system permease subunit